MSDGYYDPSPPIPHGAVHLLCCSGLLCTRIDECDYEIIWSRSTACDLLAARPQQDSNRGMIVGRES